jgi:hypothetical protein
LVHAVVPSHELDNTVATYVHELLSAAPEPSRRRKRLIPT